MVRTQLFTRNIGLPCVGTKFNGFHAPANAKTYNQFAGVGPRGQFEITSFRREDGSLAKHVSRYLDNAGNETLTIRTPLTGGGGTYQVTAINRRVREFLTRVFDISDDKKKVLLFENKLVNSDDGVTGDFHRIAHFVKGKPAREISFEPRWDGCAPNEIKYKNISRRLSGEGLEYLPLLVSESAGPRYQHVANIQMKKYGLEGMVGDVQRVPSSNLNPGCKTLEEANERFGFCVEGYMENVPPSGQVVISNEIKSSEDIIRILAHEFKHVDDLSKVLRLKYNADAFMQLSRSEIAAVKKEMPEVYNFVKKSLKKGVITKKGSDDFEYRHLKFLDKHFDPNHYYKTAATLEGHSIHPLEVGPDRVANEEVEKFNSLMIRILDLLIN